MTISAFSPSATRDVKARVNRLSRRSKWIIGIVGGAILIALAWHFIAGWLHGKPKAPPPPPVHVGIAGSQTVTAIDRTIATVVSPATVQVNAQVAGKLLAAYFREGQIVHKGDPLFQIDPAPFQNALAQAKAQLAKDTAAAQSALNDEKRYVALYAANATSQQLRDQAVATAQGDMATVASDNAAVNIAQENLGYTKIVSPIDGKTGPIVVQPGNLVSVAGTALVTIAQVQPIKISFFLPQKDLGQIQDQMAAGKLLTIISMPDAGTAPEKASVDFVSNIVNATTGTIELRATFPNDDLRLVPGQSVDIGVTLNQYPGAVVVPRDAVNAGPDSSYVLLVNKQSMAVQQPVTVLNDDGSTDAIKGDVKPGDKVITDGQLRVVPGVKVAIQKAGPKHSSAPPSDTAP